MQKEYSDMIELLAWECLCKESGANVMIGEEEAEDIIRLAKKHSVLAILSQALLNKPGILSEKLSELCKKNLMQAVFVYQRQQSDLTNVCEAFEKNEVCYMPLKGAVLRNMYTEPHLRESCDIDILVKEADASRAGKVLEQAGYTFGKKGSHDFTYISPSHTHIELHFRMVSDGGEVADEGKILQRVWQGRPKRYRQKFRIRHEQ